MAWLLSCPKPLWERKGMRKECTQKRRQTLPGRMTILNRPASVLLDIYVVGNDFYFFCLFVSDQIGQDSTDQRCHSTTTVWIRYWTSMNDIICLPGDNDDGDIGLFAVIVKVLESNVQSDVCDKTTVSLQTRFQSP